MTSQNQTCCKLTCYLGKSYGDFEACVNLLQACFTLVTNFPDSNFSLQQTCTASFLQNCHKCETSLQQINGSLEVTIGRTCRKLALQTTAKTEYEHNPG
ncbi:hypothetical protein AVEN_7379-1 [Araneus ventricosus]|uniref:Uncharacterized protein n=1 Tax=Araneus ventricosus TaxID=182803 RepID=A0A4Y2BQS7_ARAVE|nr:hypothetical protein AVEN_7379-1 [Araneus ventricosus]